MDRFESEPHSYNTRHDRDEDGWYPASSYAPHSEGAVNICENCGQACPTLIHLEGWFDGCERCADEALESEAAAAKMEPVTAQAISMKEVA